MKLGILICDHVQPQLQGEFGDYPDMFTGLLQQIDYQLEIVYISAINRELPEDIYTCDAYMTSGSRHGANDEQLWIRELEAFISKLYAAGIGFVGICFGHQLIATALGGRVEKSPKGWGIGIAGSQIVAKQSWMITSKNEINLVVSHQDQICELPPQSQVLMSSDFCPYSMIQVGEHFIGLQGHPEFSRQYSYALMDSRRDRISAEVIEAGSATLTHEADDVLVMRWLVNFLKQIR
ncbi:GMP synthase [uncultured Paraglaciecola sp.]|uniref:glutamine amidotransferase-related protein n=1 Tax=uncultured Paraglaciecola sp. TaxID=1765024 RepID=UPI00261E75C3|nr:GMP synthase [uncultured Paraglaciecola sp.]